MRELGCSLRQKRIVGQCTDAIPAGAFRVFDVNNQQISPRGGHGFAGQCGKFRIDQQHFGFSVIKDVAQRGGIEAHIIGIEYRTQHRHCQSTLQRFGNIGCDKGNRIALADAPL